MITVEVDAYRAQVRLESLPARVRGALQVKRNILTLQLEGKAKGNAPVGPSSKTHTGGQLRRSIFSQATDTATTIEGKVATGADTPYAKYVELGTAAHDIVPTKAKALAFMLDGKQVFAKSVHHPGTKGQLFMRRAFDDMKAEIIAGFKQAALEAAKK